MKITTTTIALAAFALGAFAAAATAQTVTVRDEAGKETTAPTEAAATIEPTKPQTARTCLTYTGSRITANRNMRAIREGRSERECANAGGRSYSKDDLENTGRHDVAGALRALDTGIH